MTEASRRPTNRRGIVSRAAALGVRDWLGLAEAAATLAWAHVALRWQSPAQVMVRASRPSQRRTGVASPTDIARLSWLAGVAGRRFVRVSCLSRSVALARMLARRGVAADIRVGVRTTDGRLEAHAWVEFDGHPINDDEATVRQYAPFTRPLTALTDLPSRLR